MIVPAGNFAEKSGRSTVDRVQARWASLDFPLVMAGAVDNQGSPASFSQGGSKIISYAPGVNVSCPHDDVKKFSGTSYAAPMVSFSKT